MNAGGSRAPDFIEPIAAYRAWRYFMGGRTVRLFALGSDTPDWQGAWDEWVTASCRRYPGDHDAPEEACSCGFYALKSVEDAAVLMMMQLPVASGVVGEREGCVLGRVQLAGKVIEHERGYRAERARITEFIPTTDDCHGALRLAARLDLPVGSEFDEGSFARSLKEHLQPPPIVPLRLGPVERRRLRTHERQFRLIRGGRNGEGSSN